MTTQPIPPLTSEQRATVAIGILLGIVIGWSLAGAVGYFERGFSCQ